MISQRTRALLFAAIFAFGSRAVFAAPPEVSYLRDVHPILTRSCWSCHAGSQTKGDFRLDSREALLKGGESGLPAAIPGKGAESPLIHLATEKVPGEFMPKKGARLTPQEIETLKAWIDQGLEWEAAETSATLNEQDLALKKVALPRPPAPNENPIDVLLERYFSEQKIKPALLDDGRFMRRATLDVTGLLPEIEDIKRFLHDSDPRKREKLIDRLLADNRAYAEHWISFWSDLLRNDFRGPGFIAGRKSIYSWLYTSLATNKPYDRFVRELVHPSSLSSGFIIGTKEENGGSAGRTPSLQAAQNIAHVFMGINLKCASCHDSFTSRWKLTDSYGMASVYEDAPLELIRCDIPTGRKAETRFIFPELGKIDPALPRAAREEALARLVTHPGNGRFARTIVNRLWNVFFGRGLVESMDEMDAAPWNPELQDYLAGELVSSGYDLKRLMRLILSSKAYGMPAAPDPPSGAPFVFRGPLAKRLSSEQFLDATSQLTGTWPRTATVKADFLAGYKPVDSRLKQVREQLDPVRWIWLPPEMKVPDPPVIAVFEKTFDLADLKAKPLAEAELFFYYARSLKVLLNGKEIYDVSVLEGVKNGAEVRAIDEHLIEGRNVLTLRAETAKNAPAGVLLYARLRRKGEPPGDLFTNKSWTARWEPKDSPPPVASPNPALPAAEIGGLAAPPWEIEDSLVDMLMVELYTTNKGIRAWRVKPDALAYAYGRSTREIVTTRRLAEPSRLQGLELLNGEALAKRITGGKSIAAGEGSFDSAAFVNRIYLQALGRAPSPRELELASGLLKPPAGKEALADFIWSILMLPEFQLIH